MAGFTLAASADGSALSNIQVKEVILYAGAHDIDTQTNVMNCPYILRMLRT